MLLVWCFVFFSVGCGFNVMISGWGNIFWVIGCCYCGFVIELFKCVVFFIGGVVVIEY